MNGRSQLPRILIVDDQFGRCELGAELRRAVSPDAWAIYQADRANLCALYHLSSNGISSNRESIAHATFVPGQVWNTSERQLENDADSVISAVQSGWPFTDGTRWSLILLDLRFVAGSLDEFGDPHDGSAFGADVLLPLLRTRFGADLPIVILSSTPREEANQRMRQLGALDYIERIPAGVQGCSPHMHLAGVLARHGLTPDDAGEVEGTSLPVLKMLRQARRGAASARNILLVGETGSGKGALANYIHRTSSRAARPFVAYHAAHRPPELQADELFGHWRGAFTGAITDVEGVWERANSGTLFLDELADIDLSVQQKLMQPIEERSVRRLGRPPRGQREAIDVDVLVILATNQDLGSVNAKLDFINRVNAYTIEVPPLRERIDDLPAIVQALCVRIAPGWTGAILPEALEKLRSHEWREGNVRELRNVLERALINNPVQDITATDITFSPAASAPPQRTSVSENGSEQRRRDFLNAIEIPPSQMPVALVDEIRSRYSGYLAELLADILRWSFEMERTGGRLNPTATVRFLLGRRDVSTVEAKQFLKKLLTLDTRGRSVASCFADYARESAHPTVMRIAEQALSKHDAAQPEGDDE
jgi:DNA-binding NtrC family response regulator